MGTKKKPVKKRRRIRLFVLVFLLLAVGIVGFALSSSTFTIKYVNVEGNTLLTDREVVDQMGKVRGNIFLYSPKEAILNLQKVEGIREVTIDKELPDRINVLVKESYILANLKGDPPYQVDNLGMVLDQGKGNVIKDRVVPLEVVWNKGVIEKGKPLSGDPRDIDFMIALLKTKLSDNIKLVSFDKTGNIDIMVKDILVHFGEPDDIFKKLNNVTAALKEIQTKSIPAKEIIIKDGREMIVVTEAEEAGTEK
ncbi:cell division protein FtsQ/DivIB [Kallipyga massiliensis]|uniref:cell division protein FtsQ/DivIB n=1 Tax=Kallipyga massiliensis TaxID=1472764 RepID=UPI0026EC0A8D|nr:FtsQ-type POTRA domain-containing protein [Kallipyga massiliensis]